MNLLNVKLFASKIKNMIVLIFLLLIMIVTLPYYRKKKLNPKTLKKAEKEFMMAVNEDVKASIIIDPNEALYSRIALINCAKESIDLCYYRIESYDHTSQIFIGALLEAAKRGVKINIVVDAKFGGLNNNTIRLLNSFKNINVYHYNPLSFRNLEAIQVVLHNKVMIVDQNWILSGGRNISDNFLLDDPKTKSVSYDLDVLLHSKNKDDMIHTDFFELFKKLTDPKYSVLRSYKPNKRSSKLLTSVKDQYFEYCVKHENTLSDYLNKSLKTMINVDNINLVYSSFKPINKEPLVGRVLYEIAQESNKISILTPYITGDKVILKALSNLGNTKNVTLLTNSLYSSPNFPAYSNYLIHRKNLLSYDLEIYEYKGMNNTSVHTKAYLMDDDVISIGSMNLDNRSLFINPEQMLIIKSKELFKVLSDTVETQKDLSNKVEENLLEYKKAFEKDVSFIKKIIMKLSGIILRPFQSLL